MYRVVETTDGRFVGVVLENENLYYGKEIRLSKTFSFVIDKPVVWLGGEAIISCSNYVVHVKEIGG